MAFLRYAALTLAVATITVTGVSVPGHQHPKRAPAPWSNYNDNGVFYPLENATSWRTLYARTLQLPDDSLLLTWEDYDPDVALAYWPIHRSTDGGATFSALSRVEDQVNGWGLWYQPFLYTLPEDLGEFKKGTVLIAGTSVPRNLSEAYIDIYASTDAGVTWDFVSHVAYGSGPETVTNGDKAIWEPFLLLHEGTLICYYSDQRDPAHAQKLVYETTTDLRTWSDPVDVVAQPTYTDRPGMATVAHSPRSGNYVLTFEYCGGPLAAGCPVYHKVAKSPLEFGPVEPLPIVNNGTLDPNGSPYVIWVADDADDCESAGVFIMDGSSQEDVFVNTDTVDPNGWKAVSVGQWSSYSRSLRIINTPKDSAAGGARKLLIANGGNIGCSGSCYNFVATGLVDIPSYPA